MISHLVFQGSNFVHKLTRVSSFQLFIIMLEIIVPKELILGKSEQGIGRFRGIEGRQSQLSRRLRIRHITEGNLDRVYLANASLQAY